MTISESQLEIWSRRSQTDTAINAHEAVSAALDRSRLEAARSPLRSMPPQTRLQGSYRNYTNIWADSDVDILVQHQGNGFYYNVDRLPPAQQAHFKQTHPQPSYEFQLYRQDVYAALVEYFGAVNVEDGNKAIRVKAQPGRRLGADVVPCWPYRDYHIYNGNDAEGCIEGVAFEPRDSGATIVNYPEQHYRNGVAKHESTQQRFKPTVRIFKNARNYLVANGKLASKVAPSYFIQCVLYNVPSTEYATNHTSTFIKVLYWIAHNLDTHNFLCQNGIVPLFGDQSDQWSRHHLITFVAAFLELFESGT